jgi:O-phospho-L-seryl-tRNASec:L-selenocysteinyl-tRNA synthase
MVPVGGSMVFSHDEKLLAKLNSLYPGRASISPIVDLFITLLSMGRTGFVKLLKERKENFAYLHESLAKVLEPFGERVLSTTSNKISLSFTIGKIVSKPKFKNDPTFFGSYLFKRRVMGARVVGESVSTLEGIPFKNYGSHHEDFPHLPYVTVASAIGSSRDEIDDFLELIKKLKLE